MPEHVASRVQRPWVFRCYDLAILINVGNTKDGTVAEGVIWQAHFDPTETLAEGDVLLVRDVLVVKNEHKVSTECIAKLLERIFINA